MKTLHEWNFDDALAWANELCSPPEVQEIDRVFAVLVLILKPTELAVVGEAIVKGTKLSAATMTTIIKQARTHQAEFGYVDSVARAAHLFEEHLVKRYEHVAWVGGALYHYEDGLFFRDDAQAVADYLLKVFDVPLVEKARTREEIVKRVRADLQNERFFDDAVPGLNFRNGFVCWNQEARLLSLLHHDPSFKARVQLSADFNPEAEFAWVSAAFERVLPDQSALDALQEVIASVLFGIRPAYDRERRAVFLMGPRSSGKSSIIQVLRRMYPEDAVVSVPPSEWGNPYSRAALDGKWLNMVTELGADMRVPGAYLKKLASGEPVSARQPYGRQFTMEARALHLFATNEAPRIVDRSDAFERRILVIPFQRSLAEAEVDTGFVERIASDPSALARWAMPGAERLERNERFTIPGGHATAAAVMQHGDDVAAVTVQLHMRRAPGNRVTNGELRRGLQAVAGLIGADPDEVNDGTMRRAVGAMRARFGCERRKVNGAPFYTDVEFVPGFSLVAENGVPADELDDMSGL